ncbi:hypothetical protein [Streptomyces sp. NPDC006879]|uniref:DUF7739 domain-containing protein n=1 Tax=Streptomyces sp. NPDC006879 TaxID=3364767 RepID=UPI0036A5E4F7
MTGGMSTFITTTHGADFFGEDRHPVKALRSLADYARGSLPADDREHVVQLLEGAELTAIGTVQTIPAAVAAKLAGQFRQIARSKFLRSRPLAQAVALLADAAARAAADGEPWEWRTDTG